MASPAIAEEAILRFLFQVDNVSQLAAKLLGDQHTLHLACALANLVDLDAAPVARHRIFIHKAIAAMDLYRLVCRALGRLGRKELGH